MINVGDDGEISFRMCFIACREILWDTKKEQINDFEEIDL